MSAQDSNLSSPVRYRKPRADIYTLLLAIALVALIIACIFAYMEIQDYGAQPLSMASPGAAAVETPVVAVDQPHFGPAGHARLTVALVHG